MSLFHDLNARLLVDLLRDRIRPQKSLGQHFLVDEKVISRTIELTSEYQNPLKKHSNVLEIGPGPGTLTLEILRSGAKLTALEIDNESVSHLKRIFPDLGDRFTLNEQDALIGNKAYDLASLIDDVRFKTSNSFKDKVYNYYLKSNNKININKFKEDFEILSVLRNLKIIGIFMRLALRDNKRKYLKLIPYAWDLINNRMKNNKAFDNLRLLLNDNFPKVLGR